MHSTTLKNEPKWYTTLGMLFVTFLLVSNVIAGKPIAWGEFIIPASIVVYPLTYIISVVITEVYGFSHARQIFWLAMACNVLMAVFFQGAILMPAVDGWANQAEYELVLGASMRIVIASILSFLVGQWFNAFIVSRLKIIQHGKQFWVRSLLAMGVSDAIGTAIFLSVAFLGVLSTEALVRMGLCYYGFKMVYALCALPLQSIIVNYLKRVESLDVYEAT